MSDDRLPSYAEFLKSLLLALLFESAACTAANACRMAFSAHPTAGPIAALVAFVVLIGAGLSNLGSIFAAHFTSMDDRLKPYAQTSVFLTISQTVLIGAICFSRGAAVNAVIAMICLAASLIVFRFLPGKFPPDLDAW